MEQLLQLIPPHAGLLTFALFVFSIFIEITPLKINPLSRLIKWMGHCLNKDTGNQLAAISLQLEELSRRIDKIEIHEMRSTILDFANSCIHKRKHTQEEFEHIIDLYTSYEKIIEERGMKNGRIELAYRYISDLYTACLKNNNFLV